MNRIWQWLLGIDRSPGAAPGGDARLEFTAWPRGTGSIVLILSAIAIIYLLWRLYRWEGRDLSRAKRGLLVGLRGLVLLAVAAMLLEPVWVSSQRESVPSHLAIVLDDSESMRFSDPYTDDSRAVALAADLKLPSADGKSPVERLCDLRSAHICGSYQRLQPCELEISVTIAQIEYTFHPAWAVALR